MKQGFFLLFTIALIVSCKENKVETKTISQVDSSRGIKQNLSLDKIRFGFNAHYDKKNKGFIKINATLFNANVDTVYFLTWSCDGLIYDIIYDTAKLTLFPHYSCNGSYPLIEKIPPNGKFIFDANFLPRIQINKIKLSYDFYRIENDFDIKMGDIKIIQYQDSRPKTILQTQEQLIE